MRPDPARAGGGVRSTGVRVAARTALLTAAVVQIVVNAVGGLASDGYLDDIVFGLFLAAPLLVLAAVLAQRTQWAIAQSAAFVSMSIGAVVLAEVASHSSSTGGLWVPTIAIGQYMVLLGLGAVRLVRWTVTWRRGAQLASAGRSQPL
jgi:hypothetical protein